MPQPLLKASSVVFESASKAAVQAYQRDGVVCIRGMFAPWIDRLRTAVDENMAANGPHLEVLESEDGKGGRFLNDYLNWRQYPDYKKFVYESPAAALVAQLMQSRTSIFYHEHVLVKEPGATRQTPWHHDQPYYPVDGDMMCSIWLPLDPVPASSTLLFVKGSHKLGYFVPRKFKTQANYADTKDYPSVPDVDGNPDKYEVVGWELQPGDCVVFNGKTLHGACGNSLESTSRRAFSTRWFGEDARLSSRPWELSPPITGGLKVGQPMACEEFPLIYTQNDEASAEAVQ